MEIQLREVQGADLPVFYQHQLQPEATEMAAFSARDWDTFLAHWNRIRPNKTNFLRTILYQGQVAGNLMSWEQMGQREVGYWIGKEFWGKGIATKALEQFLQLLPGPLFAHVVKPNLGSLRVLAKCGFEMIGEEKGEDGLEEFVLRLE